MTELLDDLVSISKQDSPDKFLSRSDEGLSLRDRDFVWRFESCSTLPTILRIIRITKATFRTLYLQCFPSSIDWLKNIKVKGKSQIAYHNNRGVESDRIMLES